MALKSINKSAINCGGSHFLAYRGCTGSEESVNVFIHKLAGELIEFEQTTKFQRKTIAFGAYSAKQKRKLDNIVHLTPTKKLQLKPLSTSGKRTKDNHDYKSFAKVDARRKLHGVAAIATRNIVTQDNIVMTASKNTVKTSTPLIRAK